MRLSHFLLLVSAAALAAPASAQLIFSEYIEGSSNNKALEIFNSSGGTVSLVGASVEVYLNGSASPSNTIALGPGSLSSGGVWVVANPGINPLFLEVVDQPSASINFNGDDAIALVMGSQRVDAIGQIGVDPGSAWTGAGVSTQNQTLRRQHYDCTTIHGVGPYDPSLSWQNVGFDDLSDLGNEAGMIAGNFSCGSAVPSFSTTGLVGLCATLAALALVVSRRGRPAG